jgi:uncharacterized protein (UPF0332 family)
VGEATVNEDFAKCLETGKIVRFAGANRLVSKEIEAALNDLADAKTSLAGRSCKWATIQGYYAIFHGARALVYSKNYREKSHYCLAIALRALFVDEGRLEMQLVRDFLNAMNLREAADYEAEFSERGASAVITAAEKFTARAKALLAADS